MLLLLYLQDLFLFNFLFFQFGLLLLQFFLLLGIVQQLLFIPDDLLAVCIFLNKVSINLSLQRRVSYCQLLNLTLGIFFLLHQLNLFTLQFFNFLLITGEFCKLLLDFLQSSCIRIEFRLPGTLLYLYLVLFAHYFLYHIL